MRRRRSISLGWSFIANSSRKMAYIEIDEYGTKAAAATIVMMTGFGLSPKPIEIRIDRPFLFAIQHVPTGVCLFLGHVGDPR
jgi:serine protease inhibitor